MQAQAQGIDGYGRDINDALGNLGPFAEDTATLVDILNRQEGAVTRLISNSGVVFGALTERQGQLRSLIRNSNTVFATTAARDEQLKESFVALPTFEDESRVTVRRLAEFATDTNPLVTQLRPAARELSPTLIDLSALAPDLKKLFVELNPLIDASKKGFPAAQKVLQDLRPLLAQVDPAAQQLVPLLDFIGLYKPRAERVLRQHRRRHPGALDRRRACTTCARRTRSTPRTSPSIRAGSGPTGPTRTPSRACSTSSAAGSRSTRTGTAAARSRA